MKITFERRTALSRPVLFAAPVIALGLAMLTSLILFAALGKPAGQALYSLLLEPFVGWYNISEVLLKMGPLMLIAQGLRVAVLAVDPSSPFTNGALLGDRIRFSESFTDPGVFIRSIGSRGSQGGLSALSYLLLRGFDAYEFDVVLLETVGVGQSEVEIMKYVDTVIVLLAPGMGDGIQAAKAGILEIGDIYVINKSDRDLAGAENVAAELARSIELSPRADGWKPEILIASAQENIGINEILGAVENHRKWRKSVAG